MKERGISPGTKLFKSSLAQSMAFETTPHPPPLEFNLATPNSHQMIALCLCDNMTISLTLAPLKKTYPAQRAQLALRAGLFLPRKCFEVISVNSRKLFGAHG